MDGTPTIKTVIDTHRHYVGPNQRKAMVDKGFWDDSKPLPQAGAGDIIYYRDFVDLEYSVEQQRAGGVTKALASGGGEVEWTAQILGGDEIDALESIADERLALRDQYPDDVEIMVDALALDERSRPIVDDMVTQHNARAIAVGSSYGSGEAQTFLDSPKADWLWEYASDKKLLIHVHPPMSSLGAEKLQQYRMVESTGRPFDTAVSAARMINAGVFDRYPDLQVLFVHMGGDLMPILGRLDFNWRLNYNGIADPSEDKVIHAKRKPSEYMRTNFVVDIMGFNAIAARAAIETWGIDRVVFGTDYGPVPMSPREHIDIAVAIAKDQEELDKLLWRTADRLFNLGIADATHAGPASADRSGASPPPAGHR